MSGTGATIVCVCCGLETTGRLVHGRLMPSDRVRPDPDARRMTGFCMWCAERKCRRDDAPEVGPRAAEMPRLFDPPKMPIGPKQRWVREQPE